MRRRLLRVKSRRSVRKSSAFIGRTRPTWCGGRRSSLSRRNVAQDLTDHPVEVWKKIQSDPALALRRFDKIFALASDGTWAVEARVGFADPSRVVLVKPTIIKLPGSKRRRTLLRRNIRRRTIPRRLRRHE